ncbi:MAG: LysM peptidoglycan-binding domain-containing protein [Planctomycetes bacterium]|jgi:hypothetical protein|nr:LysM peptidoglycan-binding domain-containing protein [Planctomycetota bacterium]MCL4731943.1 LysM peptidoglycan-binding domain-containing protein [Planctomycetota bacterium]
MKNVLVFLVFAGLMAGCTLTGTTQAGTARKHDPILPPAPAQVEDDTMYELDAHRPADEGAVVSRQPEAPVKIAPATDADFESGMALFADGKLRQARLALTASLNNFLPPADEARALETLREINRRIFLSAGEEGDLKLYVVRAGDTLGRLAQVNNTTVEMIQRLNGLKNTNLQVGQTLKILGGTFELVVRRSRFSMDLLLDGAFIQRYEVGLGVGGVTPLGEFKVKNRIAQPADGSWPFGHEKHRLGTRWLGLSSEAGHKGYGIHGCRPEEESLIPGECSQGCVRMRNAEVEEIFDIIPVGTRLVVIEK